MVFDPILYIPESLDKLYAKLASLGPDWIFRGVSDARWSLDSSLERLLRGSNRIPHTEQSLLERFQAEAGNYLSSGYIPHENARLEWLAIMQHFGAPTRLLDWTKSPYSALFFASELARKIAPPTCAVWAVRLPHVIRDATEAVLAHVPEERPTPSIANIMNGRTYEKYLVHSGDICAVFPYMPPRLHGRLVSQQGLFLFATNLSQMDPKGAAVPFEMNLTHNSSAHIHKSLTKILIPGKWQSEILRQLMRMNITRSSLFPGLDGFATSLTTLIRAYGDDIPWP